MSEWKNVQIKKIALIVSGTTPSSFIDEYWNGDIVWITPVDLSNTKTRFINSSERRISKNGLANIRKLIPAGSIVMSSRAPIGYFAIATEQYTTNQGCKSFVFHDGQEPEYHYYNFILNKNEFLNKGSGSTFQEISKKAIENISFNIPTNVKEQKGIATILATIDEAIETTEKVIAKRRLIKEGLMQNLFRYGLDEKGNLRSEATHKFKNSPLGKIPEEWEVVTIAKISKIRRGASPRPIDDPKYFADNGRGWIRIADVTMIYKYLRKTSQYLSSAGENNSVKVNPGDLIMSICATIGKPAILDMEACIHDGFVWFNNLSNEVNTEWLFQYIYFNQDNIKNMKQTGTQGNLNTGIVKKFKILKPTFTEQTRISSVLSAADDDIEMEETYLEKLNSQKRGLMEDLLTGKVRVNNVIKEAVC